MSVRVAASADSDERGREPFRGLMKGNRNGSTCRYLLGPPPIAALDLPGPTVRQRVLDEGVGNPIETASRLPAPGTIRAGDAVKTRVPEFCPRVAFVAIPTVEHILFENGLSSLWVTARRIRGQAPMSTDYWRILSSALHCISIGFRSLCVDSLT